MKRGTEGPRGAFVRPLMCAALALVVMLSGCARQVVGAPVVGDTRPHDVWQLVDDLIRRSPVKPDGLSKILGADLKSTGGGTYRGGPVELGPELTIPAVRMVDLPVVAAILIAVKTPECVRLADVQAHYPEVVKRVSIIQGGKVTEQWAATHPWGGLSFAIQQPPGCVQSLEITYPKIKR